MDFDLEIINEESDCPDPLFDSIMNAMNSMKEATADKIYQKIQKEGETNYSKPQVDRALASALKYGIFEVKNNRYRVRDDILDDEDTVYWKLQKKREQTPFRIQDNTNDRTFGPKLDPEKDNLRFRNLRNSEGPECPQCGRTKRPSEDDINNSKHRRISKRKIYARSGDEKEKEPNDAKSDYSSKRKKCEPEGAEKRKKRNEHEPKTNQAAKLPEKKCELDDPFDRAENNKDREIMEQNPEKDINDSENDSMFSLSDDDQSVFSVSGEDNTKYHDFNKPHAYLPECEEVEQPDEAIVQVKRSSTSFKTESESDRSDESSISEDQNQPFFENVPCSSRNSKTKDLGNRNQYTTQPETFNKQYGRGQTDQCERKSEWMGGCSEEPQGTIIQSNNVLTIEPMDSLAFKSSEQASYIS